ncbi:MAG: MerR family DNA-binding protein [Halioglobus sp.]|nr:MerR family DNA-binding protein [Halioglobus sp.]
MHAMTIGKLARLAEVGVDTVRYYERLGLLPQAKRAESGYRLYSQVDVDRLSFIRRAKTLGFSLEDIAELLTLNAAAGDRAEVKRLSEQRLDSIELKIRELMAIRDALASLVTRCSGRGPIKSCPIIEGVLAQGLCTHQEK